MIENSFKKERLSHAYIFEGDAGTMRFDVALFFAAKLFCRNEKPPCFECNQCKRVLNLTHPNLYVVRLQKTAIVKDDIKALQAEFSKTALEEGPKIYIIEAADKMNAHAQNALLKFLEEPHPSMYAILLCEDAGKLLPTIQSRAQNLHFKRLSDKAIETALVQEGFEMTSSRLAARLESTVETARGLLDESDLEDLTDVVKAVYRDIAGEESPLLTLQKEAGQHFNDSQKLRMLIDIFIHYQKDLIYGKINSHNQIVFAEEIDTIESCVKRYELDDLIAILEQMLTIKTRQNNFINMRLAFDNLMLALESRRNNEE